MWHIGHSSGCPSLIHTFMQTLSFNFPWMITSISVGGISFLLITRLLITRWCRYREFQTDAPPLFRWRKVCKLLTGETFFIMSLLSHCSSVRYTVQSSIFTLTSTCRLRVYLSPFIRTFIIVTPRSLLFWVWCFLVASDEVSSKTPYVFITANRTENIKAFLIRTYARGEKVSIHPCVMLNMSFLLAPGYTDLLLSTDVEQCHLAQSHDFISSQR